MREAAEGIEGSTGTHTSESIPIPSQSGAGVGPAHRLRAGFPIVRPFSGPSTGCGVNNAAEQASILKVRLGVSFEHAR